MNHLLTIGQVARRAGLHTSAIRYYESIGLIAPPGRVSGQRRYDAPVIERLAAIRAAQSLGFTLAEIATLLDGFDRATPPSTRWQSMAARKLPEIDATIALLTRLKHILEAGQTCACPRIEDCLTTRQPPAG